MNSNATGTAERLTLQASSFLCLFVFFVAIFRKPFVAIIRKPFVAIIRKPFVAIIRKPFVAAFRSPALRMPSFLCLFVFFVAISLRGFSAAAAEDSMLKLNERQRQAVPGGQAGTFKVAERTVEWDPRHTAVIICDMWDDHWCKGAAKRVAELAGPMNRVVGSLRDRGVLVIHSPSTTVDFYKDTPQRRRAQSAPFSKPPVELSTSQRWGTAWCWPDAKREAELPIDDSDMGCDCPQKCKIREAWTRQIATIDIAEPDAISDNGQEVYNLLRQHQIDHVLILGVHLNMCVLGRPFAIRQLKYLGQDVVLVRDMTDTMYNHEQRPMVDHFAGTDLVVEHIEKFWCPTITSADLVGGQPFRFAEDKRK